MVLFVIIFHWASINRKRELIWGIVGIKPVFFITGELYSVISIRRGNGKQVILSINFLICTIYRVRHFSGKLIRLLHRIRQHIVIDWIVPVVGSGDVPAERICRMRRQWIFDHCPVCLYRSGEPFRDTGLDLTAHLLYL